MDKNKDAKSKDVKSSSAEFIADLLTDPRVRRGLTETLGQYLGGEEFRAERERIRRGAGERIRNIRNRYRPKKRTLAPLGVAGGGREAPGSSGGAVA